MTITIANPAPLPELLALFAVMMPPKLIVMQAAILQGARSETIGFMDGDRLVAAAMLYPLDAERPGERLVELAFICLPEISQHLIPLIHHAHLTRAALAQSGLVRVRAHVRADHLPGKRLARLCGMDLVGRFGAFDRFEFEGAPDGRASDPCTDLDGDRRRRRLRGEQADGAGHLEAGSGDR